MSFEKDIILKFNQYLKSVKMPYIIYADIKPLIKKNGSANNSENSSATKRSEHILCGYSMPAVLAYDHMENKDTFISWGRLYGKVFWIFKRTHKKYIRLWKENNFTFNKKKLKPHQDAKLC